MNCLDKKVISLFSFGLLVISVLFLLYSVLQVIKIEYFRYFTFCTRLTFRARRSSSIKAVSVTVKVRVILSPAIVIHPQVSVVRAFSSEKLRKFSHS
jgi:hypothetical protein